MFGSTGCWLGECDNVIKDGGGFSGGARAMPAPFCGNASTVAHAIVGVQCLALEPAHATSATECEAACCAMGHGCATWLWNGAGGAGSGCYTGAVACAGPSNPAWSGASSFHVHEPPPPAPPPPLPSAELPRLTPRPRNVTGVLGAPWLDLNGVWQFYQDASNTSVAPAPIQVCELRSVQPCVVPWHVDARHVEKSMMAVCAPFSFGVVARCSNHFCSSMFAVVAFSARIFSCHPHLLYAHHLCWVVTFASLSHDSALGKNVCLSRLF